MGRRPLPDKTTDTFFGRNEKGASQAHSVCQYTFTLGGNFLCLRANRPWAWIATGIRLSFGSESEKGPHHGCQPPSRGPNLAIPLVWSSPSYETPEWRRRVCDTACAPDDSRGAFPPWPAARVSVRQRVRCAPAGRTPAARRYQNGSRLERESGYGNESNLG
jgi:hypothetical protein